MLIYKEIRCPMCDCESKSQFIKMIGEFKLYLCPVCGIVYANPISHPGASKYIERAKYLAVARTPVLSIRNPGAMLRKVHWEFLKDCPSRGGRLLDVGCGYGEFLAVASKNYDVVGTDLDSNSIVYAESRYGLKQLHLASLEEYIDKWRQEKEDNYDVITLFDVLEHLEKPKVSLNIVKEMLRPGGCIAVSMPNRDRWPNLHEASDCPPWHLTKWNRKSLANALRANGFDILKIKDITEPGTIFIEATNKIALKLIGPLADSTFVNAKNMGTLNKNILGWVTSMRLETSKYLEWPLDSLLRIAKVQGQGLYCLAIKI